MKRWAWTCVLMLAAGPSWAQEITGRTNFSTLTAGTLTVNTRLLLPNGSAAAPSVSMASEATGIYFTSGNLIFVTGGAIRAYVSSNGLGAYNGNIHFGSSADLYLIRDAADNLAQRRAANPQKFSIAGTYTDASNYERGFLSAGATGLIVGHEAAGTGTKRDVRIQGNAKNVAIFSGTTVTMTDETAVTVMTVTVPDNSMCQVTFEYGNIVVSASEYQGHDGTVSLLVGEDPDAAASYACSVEEETEHVLASAGTLTDSWACTAGASTVVQGNFNSTLDVAGALTLNVTHSSGCVITIP